MPPDANERRPRAESGAQNGDHTRAIVTAATVKWLSKPAVLWALDEADVPARLVSTLIAIARYSDEHGRGAYPSAATVALHTRKTERQAKRDLADLVSLGLLHPGNQRMVIHIRADRRPTVYDLAVPVDKPPRGDTHDTPSTHHGVTPMTARGDIQSPNGVSPMSPEESLKNSGKGAPPARDAADAADGTPEDQTLPSPPDPEIADVAALIAETKAKLAKMKGSVRTAGGTP